MPAAGCTVSAVLVVQGTGVGVGAGAGASVSCPESGAAATAETAIGPWSRNGVTGSKLYVSWTWATRTFSASSTSVGPVSVVLPVAAGGATTSKPPDSPATTVASALWVTSVPSLA